MFCKTCGTQIDDTAAVCPNCGASAIDTNSSYYPKSSAPDKKSTALCVISFLCPIVGLVLFLVKKEETPNAARAYGKSALINVIIATVLSILIAILGPILFITKVKDCNDAGESQQWSQNEESNYDEYDSLYNYDFQYDDTVDYDMAS